MVANIQYSYALSRAARFECDPSFVNILRTEHNLCSKVHLHNAIFFIDQNGNEAQCASCTSFQVSAPRFINSRIWFLAAALLSVALDGRMTRKVF
jgi:hypothetical protein